VADPGGQNRFFFVGDLNQKVFPKQHHTVRAGFDFTGRARTLTRNYRNTKQILRAAYCIPEHFPPQADEQLEIAAAELSQYEGGQPVCLGCTRENHVRRVLEIVRGRRGSPRISTCGGGSRATPWPPTSSSPGWRRSRGSSSTP
jgi:superfamily I DNA/RNA helicase